MIIDTAGNEIAHLVFTEKQLQSMKRTIPTMQESVVNYKDSSFIIKDGQFKGARSINKITEKNVEVSAKDIKSLLHIKKQFKIIS